MASGPAVFPSTKENTNYARLCRLLVDVGSQALRDTFDRVHSPATLHRILSSTSAHYATLQSLRKRKILNPTQWGKLYPTVCSSVSSGSFDITLLVVLLRNICGFSPPASTGSWDKLPPPGDNSCEANIARIKYYRNEVYAHASQGSVDDATFNILWQDISNALLSLGFGTTYASAISLLKTECMDPDFEEHYRKLLKQWKMDDDNTKEKLDELKDMLKKWRSDEGSTKEKLENMEGFLLKSMLLIPVLCLATLLYGNYSELKGFMLTYWNDEGGLVLKGCMIVLVGSILLFLYQRHSKGSMLRYWYSRIGSTKGGRTLTFVYTTYNHQIPTVNGVEFSWENLKKKLDLPFDRLDEPGIHYYLNTDRYAYGGTIHVCSRLDNLPQVGGAEVLAVNADCTKVYFEEDGIWKPYRSARNIRCTRANRWF